MPSVSPPRSPRCSAARLLQGVGAGTVNPQVLGIIQETFAGRDRTRALGAYAIVGGIAGVIGPIVGGSLIGALGSIVVLHAVDEHWLGVGLAVTQFASGAASGLIISPNQALTLMHAPPHSAGLAAAFLQLAQRVSATIGTAAVAGVVLGGAGLGPISSGLGICAAMLAAAVVVSARDLARDSLTSSLNIYTR